jgi:hypothetical protein
MNLTLHILKADVRRFAWPIVAWTALTIAGTVVNGIAPRLATEVEMWPFFALSAVLLWVGRMIFAAAIIVLVVQTHATVGSRAFWLTRPIPRGALVASKMMLLIAVVAGVPALTEAALMVVYDVPAGDMAKVTVEWGIVRAIAVLAIMVLAALTRSLAQFALVCGALAAAAAVASTLVAAAARLASRGAVGVLTAVTGDVVVEIQRRWPDATPAIASWVVLISTFVLVLWVQYHARSRRRSIALAGGGLLVAAVVAVAWPWPLLHAEPGEPGRAESGETMRLEAPAQAIWFDNGGFQLGDGPRWHTAHAEMYVKGLAEGWFASVQLLRGRLTFDGQTLRSGVAPAFTIVSAAPGAPDTKKAALLSVLDVDVIRDQWNTLSYRPAVLYMRHEDLPVARTRGAYDGEFRIDLNRVEPAGMLPLAEGATFLDRGYRLRVNRVDVGEGGPRISATISRTFSLFDRAARPQYSVYLRNRRTREAIEGQMQLNRFHVWQPGPLMLGAYSPLGFYTGFFVDAYQIRFPSSLLPYRRSGSFTPGPWTQPGWLEGAEIVVVRVTGGASLTRTVTIPQVALNGGAVAK